MCSKLAMIKIVLPSNSFASLDVVTGEADADEAVAVVDLELDCELVEDTVAAPLPMVPLAV